MVKIAEKYPQWTAIMVSAVKGPDEQQNYCAESLKECLQNILGTLAKRKVTGWSLSPSGLALLQGNDVWVVLPEDFEEESKFGVALLIAAGERALYPQQPVVAKPKKAVAKKTAKATTKATSGSKATKDNTINFGKKEANLGLANPTVEPKKPRKKAVKA